MAHCATPGISLGLIDGCQIDWAKGYGKRCHQGGELVQTSTPFQAGSISKPVFALAIMTLVQDGRLDLDADVNGYLTSWRVPSTVGWQPKVTLRQLLSHTAGTTVHGFPGYPASGPWPTVLQILNGETPANTRPVVVDGLPGTQFRYSGGGTTIAQQVLVDVLERPFPRIMEDLVLGPLGMADSTYEQPLPPPIAARAAIAHPWNGVPTPGGWHVYPEMAAAGLWTTARDLALLGHDFLSTLQGRRSQLGLKQETAEAMLRPQLPEQTSGQDSFMGLGWQCAGEGDSFRFGHDGADHGFLARLRLVPAGGQGAIAMINSIQGWPLLDELFGAIRHEYSWPLFEDLPKAISMPDGIDYAGTYSDQWRKVMIEPAPDALYLAFGDQDPLRLLPQSTMAFFAPAINLSVVFERNEAGNICSMALTQHDETIDLRREAPQQANMT